jgi:hypothetical protein
VEGGGRSDDQQLQPPAPSNLNGLGKVMAAIFTAGQPRTFSVPSRDLLPSYFCCTSKRQAGVPPPQSPLAVSA